MRTMQDTLCRLCAELKRADKLLDLETDAKKYNEVQTKLLFLNATYVDISTNVILPRAICLVCYDALNKVHEFLNKVRKAQDLISARSTLKEGDITNQEPPSFEDILNSHTHINSSKPELTTGVSTNTDVQVKIEHKYTDGVLPVQNIDSDSMNVHDILEAAFSPFSRDDKYDDEVGMYAKEVPLTPKTEIVSDSEEPLIKLKLKRKSKIKDGQSKKKSKKIKQEVDGIVSWNSYPWVCAYCKVQFHSADSLRSHSRLTHNKCGAFMCVDCKYYGPKDDYEGFVKHVRKRHRLEYRNVCQYCDEIVKPRHLPAHILQHLRPPCIPCVSCGEILPNEEAFKLHIQSYMTVPKKPRRKPNTPLTKQDLTCHTCHNVYKTVNSLRDHIKNQHSGDRRREYTCDKCGKMYFSKGTLTSHVMKHDQIKPHACRICPRAFLYPNQLRRHVDTHTGVKPHACAQCGRCFRLRCQLLNHAIIHTDSMPYKCGYCTKTFRFKQILVNHERQHTGAKPYGCEVCGMQFTCWSNYNKHMKRRHNTDTARKKITAQGVFPIDPLTGQVMQPVISGLEEWKEQIMLPVKRGKKPAAKAETTL